MIIIELCCTNAACVLILPNDDAYGVFSFNTNSLMTVLQETESTPTSVNGNHSNTY